MNIKPKLIERFFSETPDFWKVLDLIGLILIGLATVLHEFGALPLYVIMLGSAGGTLSLISKFAKKDMQTLEASTDVLQTTLDMLPELKQQGEAVIKQIKPGLEAFREAIDQNNKPKE